MYCNKFLTNTDLCYDIISIIEDYRIPDYKKDYAKVILKLKTQRRLYLNCDWIHPRSFAHYYNGGILKYSPPITTDSIENNKILRKQLFKWFRDQWHTFPSKNENLYIYKNTKINCDCGRVYRPINYMKHMKTAHHRKKCKKNKY